MAYNKLKAHEYYMKHRKLKGRKRKNALAVSEFGSGSKPKSKTKLAVFQPTSGGGIGVRGSGITKGGVTGTGISAPKKKKKKSSKKR